MKDSRRPAARLLLLCLLFALALPGNARGAPRPAAMPSGNAPQPAALLPDPVSVTLAGDLQSELGCPVDWAPSCAATNLTLVGNGVWRGEFPVPAGSWSYKIALNGGWDESYPAANRALALAAPATVRFYYDHKTHAVLDSVNENNRVAVAVGSFQSELDCPGDWQPDCVRSLMSDPDGDGVFSFTTNALAPGAYELKVALNESWAISHPANNVPFAITVAGQSVTARWNSGTNEVTASVESVVSAPDNNVEYDGLRHDSRSDRYRVPFGAVTPGRPVTLRFRTYHNDVTGVRARIYDTAAASQSFKQLTLAARDVGCAEPRVKTCDFWTTTVTPTQRGLLYYRFIVTDGSATAFYEDDARLDGGPGEALPATQDRSYNIYVYDADFATPDWAGDATIYQIFVERFRNGDPANDPTDNPATDRGWFYPTERGHRFPITPWNSIVPDPEPYTDPSRPYWATYSSTMYGGDLIGVTQKISDGYFGRLGVTALYLNPIFDSPSNHKYDGRDYRAVDPAFGGKPAFDELIRVAHAHGLKVILDGVPNHVSSDSPFFDRFGRYPAVVGACESLSSPYRSWFFFEPAVPAGTGACAGDTNYRGWFGVATLPQINTAHPEVLAYWFGTPGGRPELPSNTAGYWIEQGADGWRIDVVPDVVGVNPTFFETWRDTMKASNPDSILYSETWPEADVRERVLGDEFDSTMNYRYRKAVLGLLRDTRWTDNDGGQEIDPLSPSQFVSAFETMREDYPKPAFDTAMNLIDSHDTNRAVHVLNEEGFTGSGYERQPVDGFAAARQRLSQVAVLQMTLPGAPTIYYGDEVGLTGYGFDVPRDDPYNRQPYPWADEPGYASLPAWRQSQAGLLAHYQAAGRLRRDHSFLRTGSFDVLRADDAAEILAYGRRDSTGAAVVVFNRGAAAQTVTLDLTGYVPAGTVLTRTLPLGAALPPDSGASYSFSLPAGGYGVWITPPGADMTPPPAPANLAATPGNAVVGLTWSSVPGASGYNVYRSFLPGGGYQQIQATAATAFNDTTAANGRRYYYVVKATDAAGNESAPSNEAAATPAFPVTYAVLQWPKTINHTVGVAPTQLIYGQVFVGGITDSAGSPALIRAEVGFGPEGSNPSGWTGWQPMAFNTAAGNNYEYQGRLRPEQPGNFDMLVRFSTNGGLTWAYGDKDGFYSNESGTDDPGDLAVVANPDTTPPAAPIDLTVADWSDDYIALAWQPVGDAELYRLYRSTITGTFDFSAPLAEIAAPATAYTDTVVASGVRYHYVVKAFDPALNPSPPSNEVSQVAAPKLVNLVFNLIVPAGTPGVPTIAGNNAQAFGQTWNPGAAPLTQTGPNTWRYQATVLDGTALEYKYARGSWEKVEKQIDGNAELPNRLLTVDFGAAGAQVVTDTVANWRDPFVLGHFPAPGEANVPLTTQVRVTWNQEMSPAADFTVAGPSGPVSGTFAYDSPNRTTIWTPAAPLAVESQYTVTVAGELDPNGDAQQVASVWSFITVPAERGLDLTASAAEGGAPAGGQVRFTLTLTNTGNVPDSYALSRAGGTWTASFPATVGPLAPGQRATIQVAVDVPASAPNGASDALTLTARSQADPSAERTVPFTARNGSLRSFALTAAVAERSGPAGGQVQHTLTLTNTGTISDSYALSRSGGLWAASLPASVGPLAPGQSQTIAVTVNVPTGAANGASDTLTVAAASQALPAVTRTLQLTTRNATRRLYLPWIQRPAANALLRPAPGGSR